VDGLSPPPAVPVDQLVPGQIVREWTEGADQLRARAAVDPATGWPSAYVFRYRLVEQALSNDQARHQLAAGAALVRSIPALGLVVVRVEIPA
jgi:hypothetical protein